MEKTVAVMGFGEGGRYLAGALARAPGLKVAVYDAGMGDPAFAERARGTAGELGVTIHGEAGPWLGEADVVFSLVPGTAARQVGETASALMADGAIFCDLNSITGDMMRDVAVPVGAAGLRVVDGSVLGNFAGGGKPPVLLVGDGASEVGNLLPADKFTVDIIEGKVGDASSIKMLRSILMKGVEALFIECLVTAERQGVREALLGAFKDVDARPFSKTIEIMTATHLVHAERRMSEIDRVLSVLEAEGVWDVMTIAARKVYRNTVDAGVRPADGKVKPLPESLRILDGIYDARNGP